MAIELATAYVSIVPSMRGVAEQITKSIGDASSKAGKDGGESSGRGFSSAFGAKIGAISGLVSSVVTKAANVVSSSLSGAISRVDQLNNFPKVMANLGYSAEDAARSLDKMDKGISGLPTSLDSMTGMVQQIAPVCDSLDEATDLSLAFNDALLAGGKSADLQGYAMEQYSQILSTGSVELEGWRSIMTAMPGQLNQVAQALLGPTANSMDLYQALKDGTVSVDQFNDAIMQLDKQGVNGFASFHDQAKTATDGIQTSFQNVETAVKRNLGNIVQALGAGGISSAIQAFGGLINQAGQWVVDFINGFKDTGAFDAMKTAIEAVGKAIESLGNAFGAIAETIAPGLQSIDGASGIGQTLGTVFKTAAGIIQTVADKLTQFGNWMNANAQPIAVLLTTIGGGFAAFKGYQALNTGLQALTGTMTAVTGGLTGMKNGLLLIMDLGGPVAALKQFASQLNIVQTAQSLWTAATKLATAAQGALNMVLSANPIMLVVTAIAALVAALAWFFTQTETGRQLWQQFTDFLGTTVENVKQWFGDAAQWISDKWNALVAWFQSVPGMIKGFFSDIGSWFGAKFNEAGQAIQNAWNAVVSFVQSIPGRIKGFFGDIGSWFSNKFNEVKNGIQSKFNEAVDWVRGIPNRILSALGNLGSLLWNAGSSIINGFLNGLKSAWSGVTGFVSGIGSWIAAHKGPLSYDRRLLIPAGEAIMGGFRKSMMAGWRKVQDDVMGMSLDLAGGFSPSIGMAYTPSPASAGANVTITNYYPQADPWPLRTADESDHSFYE